MLTSEAGREGPLLHEFSDASTRSTFTNRAVALLIGRPGAELRAPASRAKWPSSRSAFGAGTVVNAQSPIERRRAVAILADAIDPKGEVT